MKAIVQDRYGSADVLKLEDVERPRIRPDEVLIRVHAAGVDPSVWHLMTGLPYVVRLGLGLRRPRARVRGLDVAGQIEEVGADVTALKPGDPVYGSCDGSFAEFAKTRADKVSPLPANLSFEQAAVVATSGITALQALRDKGDVRAGQHVLVIGAGGGVGTYAVQLAKAFGARVTGVCGPTKVDLVQSIGADEIIDYTREDFADGARRFDLIIDNAGNRTLSLLRRALSPRGTVVMVGGEDGGKMLGGLDRLLRGMVMSPFTGRKFKGMLAVSRQKDLLALTELIEAGQVTPVLERTFTLTEAADAIRYLHAGQVRGKVAIVV